MNKRHSRFSRLNTLRGWSVAVIVVISAVATPALAQPWSGSATLGVQIRGSNGPVEAALVEIRYRRPGLTAGPEARRTDAQGQANFVGITPGRWSLEIRHPDFLSFVASVNVETGRKTDVVTQFLEASGPGRKTFKVKFLRNDRPLGEAVPGTATHQTTETKPAPPKSAQASPEASPPVRQRMAQPQPPEPPPSAEPAPAADSSQVPNPVAPTEPAEPKPMAPIPAPAPPAPPAVEDAPETEVADQPSVGIPSPEELAPPEALEAPETPETPELPSPEQVMPTASPEPEQLPSAPGVPVSLTAFRDRTCVECKAGEWATEAQIEVPGGEPCRSTSEVAVRRAMRDVAAVASSALADFSGPLPTDLDQPPLSLASEAARNTLAGYLDSVRSCRFLALVVPAGASFTGFRLEAEDARAGGECSGDQECEIGQARFIFSPAVARGSGAAIVYSVFENTGGELRKAKMKGFFLPPSGWSPD